MALSPDADVLGEFTPDYDDDGQFIQIAVTPQGKVLGLDDNGVVWLHDGTRGCWVRFYMERAC